jgi:hypothetical protein
MVEMHVCRSVAVLSELWECKRADRASARNGNPAREENTLLNAK